MSTPKRLLRNLIYKLPYAEALWPRLHLAFGGGQTFSGWGMVTSALPPWQGDDGDDLARRFKKVDREVVSRVVSGTFRLSQFSDAHDQARLLKQLMWRHYIVFWSARFAARATASPVKTLVECGVCDGLTAYYAMSAMADSGPFNAFLYDAWEGMKADYLLESEKSIAGSYAYLSVENTANNLSDFAKHSQFVKGFIPESFETGGIPPELVWLHIDLNASQPTTAALEALFDRIPPGGVILFDDYGWGAHRDTKTAVDRFFATRAGLLLPMPTGQAMFFKLTR